MLNFRQHKNYIETNKPQNSYTLLLLPLPRQCWWKAPSAQMSSKDTSSLFPKCTFTAQTLPYKPLKGQVCVALGIFLPTSSWHKSEESYFLRFHMSCSPVVACFFLVLMSPLPCELLISLWERLAIINFPNLSHLVILLRKDPVRCLLLFNNTPVQRHSGICTSAQGRREKNKSCKEDHKKPHNTRIKNYNKAQFPNWTLNLQVAVITFHMWVSLHNLALKSLRQLCPKTKYCRRFHCSPPPEDSELANTLRWWKGNCPHEDTSHIYRTTCVL